jgi:hypothetical protein
MNEDSSQSVGELILHLHQGGITLGSVRFVHVGPPEPDHEICSYEVQHFLGNELRVKVTVTHRHPDGPWVLVREAMRVLALS